MQAGTGFEVDDYAPRKQTGSNESARKCTREISNTDKLRSLLWLCGWITDLSSCQCCLQMKGQVIADVTFRHGKRALAGLFAAGSASCAILGCSTVTGTRTTVRILLSS